MSRKQQCSGMCNYAHILSRGMRGCSGCRTTSSQSYGCFIKKIFHCGSWLQPAAIVVRYHFFLSHGVDGERIGNNLVYVLTSIMNTDIDDGRQRSRGGTLGQVEQ